MDDFDYEDGFEEEEATPPKKKSSKRHHGHRGDKPNDEEVAPS